MVDEKVFGGILKLLPFIGASLVSFRLINYEGDPFYGVRLVSSWPRDGQSQKRVSGRGPSPPQRTRGARLESGESSLTKSATASHPRTTPRCRRHRRAVLTRLHRPVPA